MFKKRSFIFVILIALMTILCWGMVVAQLKIGYIDSQKILATYPEALDAGKKLDAENTKWGQELQKMNEEFQSLQEKLDQQSLLLSEEKKRERAQELQNLALKIQKFQNEKWGEQGELFRRREELLKPVIDKIYDVINRIGAEENYDFVFDSVGGNLLFTKEKYDLTDRVLDELEKETTAKP